MAGDITRITYRYEKWRALAAGILEAASSIFLLLMAVRWYDAGPYAREIDYSQSQVVPALNADRATWITEILRKRQD